MQEHVGISPRKKCPTLRRLDSTNITPKSVTCTKQNPFFSSQFTFSVPKLYAFSLFLRNTLCFLHLSLPKPTFTSFRTPKFTFLRTGTHNFSNLHQLNAYLPNFHSQKERFLKFPRFSLPNVTISHLHSHFSAVNPSKTDVYSIWNTQIYFLEHHNQ